MDKIPVFIITVLLAFLPLARAAEDDPAVEALAARLRQPPSSSEALVQCIAEVEEIDLAHVWWTRGLYQVMVASNRSGLT
jgi:hypothetical protein